MKHLPWIVMITILTLSMVLSACGPAPQSPAQAAAAVEEAATSVRVGTAETGDISVIFSYSADLEAETSLSVMPGASGRIEKVHVAVGDTIAAGDPIAEVEKDTYAVQLKQAEASLEAAKLQLVKMDEGTRPEQIAAAQAAVQFARDAVNDVGTVDDNERTSAAAGLAQAEAALKLAQADYDKVAWSDRSGMMPQSLALQQATIAYEAARAAYDMQTNPGAATLSPLLAQLAQAELALALAEAPFTQTDYDLAEAQVTLAESGLDLAKLQMEETVIRSPISGVVAEVYVKAGDMASPAAPVAVVISEGLEASFEVEEGRIAVVHEGQPASVQVAAYPGEDFPAVVTSVAPAADASTHTFTVKVTPAEDSGRLRSGMFANVSLLVDEKQEVVLVPNAAVTQVGDQDVVFVVDGNTAQQRSVTIGATDSACCTEIVDGVSAGETVVIAGQANLQDGDKVEIRESLN
jgi:HlyD family secretion protein